MTIRQRLFGILTCATLGGCLTWSATANVMVTPTPGVRTNIKTVLAQRAAGGDDNVNFFAFTTPNSNPGCDYHPSVATHAAMAVESQTGAHLAPGW